MFKVDQSRSESPSSTLEIPASLMQKILDKTNDVGAVINESISNIQRNKEKYRSEIKDLLCHEKIVERMDLTVCGIDGSYIVERLLGTDLLFSCALFTEGIFSKLGQQDQQQQQSISSLDNYGVFVHPEKHDEENALLARAIMLQMEIKLASSAPFDVIYIDGSLTTALIHMYKAVNMIKDNDSLGSKKIKDDFEEFLSNYKKILLGESDNDKDHYSNNNKIWLGIPKYTSRNDIGQRLNWPSVYDDRAILTMVLETGEYTKPLLFTNEEGWHHNLPYQNDTLEELMGDVIYGIRKLHVVYYKPHPWSPAIRIELPFYIAEDKNKLEILLHNIKCQCEIPSIMEPFPLYMADRIAKKISPAISAYKQIIINQLINEPGQHEKDILFMMHSYRTESGYN